MKDETIICDICGCELKEHSEHTLHLKFKEIKKAKVIWWWYGDKSNIYEIDICGTCYHLIKNVSEKDDFTGFRKAYKIYKKMCVADMNEFDEKVIELAKKQDRYYENHPID